jgi:hypothetical protein
VLLLVPLIGAFVSLFGRLVGEVGAFDRNLGGSTDYQHICQKLQSPKVVYYKPLTKIDPIRGNFVHFETRPWKNDRIVIYEDRLLLHRS